MSTKEVVLVTGSSGCLGQHIVKLLQERDDQVGEIRLFDETDYANKLGHSDEKIMTEFVADIRNTEKLLEAMEGVDCVIHTAAVIDLRVVPDVKTMESVNINGTRAVIDACLQKNVHRLVFASSTDAVLEAMCVFYGAECTTPTPTSFLVGKYAESKYAAEKLVLEASGQICSNGKTVLRTLALRPPAFYGEGDKYFFTQLLKLAKRSNGCYYRVKRLDERLQNCYVGNVAWAFLKAKEKLTVDETLSGEAFFITDDTPITDVHESVQPYMEARGFRVSEYIIPYWLAWILLSVICLGVRMINYIISVDFDVPNVNILNYFCSTKFFNRSKANFRLEYQPIYTPEEARRRSLRYYKNVAI